MEKPTPAKRAKQKRNRIITACFDCRERKAGCDRKKPICSRCQDGRICIYLDPPNKALINGESRKVSSLPGDIKDKVSRLYSQCLGDAKDGGDQSDYEELEATPLVTESASYDDDVDETEVTDLGFRVGKLHLTDRIGGQYRPKVAQEVSLRPATICIAYSYTHSSKCFCSQLVINVNGARSKLSTPLT